MPWTCRIASKTEAFPVLEAAGLIPVGGGTSDVLNLAERGGHQRIIDTLGYVPLFGAGIQQPDGSVRIVDLLIFCPLCGKVSSFAIAGPRAHWTWNGDREHPTFTPSLKWRECTGHFTVTGGVMTSA